VKCSVVVPVFNPGPSLTRCVDSLLGQTMSAGDYELVLVDDGSTDGTAGRLDALAAAHGDRAQVIHIPASGWPGRPRNVGVEVARGEYVHFVDNDDVLPPYALQAMYDVAAGTDADIVLGRPASDFRHLVHTIYRRPVTRATLAGFPALTETLTPHKMFRREPLICQDIRFPEGPVPLEDQGFVLKAYLRARSIAVLTDRPYYFYLRRLGAGRNAGDRFIDPVAHFAALERVLDVVEADVADLWLRDRLFRRSYRIVLLDRLQQRSMLDAGPARQRAMFGEVRRVVITRFGPGVRAAAGARHRVQGRLVEDDDLPGTLALARELRRTGLRTVATVARWRAGTLELGLDGTLLWGEGPLHCERTVDGWALPAALAPSVPVADRLLDGERDAPDVELSLLSRVDSASYGIVDGLSAGVDDAGVIRVRGTVALDPMTAMAGKPLDDGSWQLRLLLFYAGFSPICAVELPEPDAPLPPPGIAADGRPVQLVRIGRRGALGLDVGQWHHPLAPTVVSSARLAASGRRELHLTVDAAAAGRIAVQLSLAPEDGAPGDLVSCSGRLGGDSGMAASTLRLRRPLPSGSFRPWLTIGEPGAAPPVALPWRVRSSAGRLHVEPANATAG
jgi:glycosyltransferase involved in cell wall biosynthesis